MGRVLVTRRLPDGGLDPLAGHDVVGPNARDEPFTKDELCAYAGNVDAIVSLLTDKIDADVVAAGAGNVRVIANVAVGFDNIDVAAAHAHGITVCNTPGVLDETTADLAFALILAASRVMSEAEADLRTGRWHGWGVTQYLGRDVHGATLGLVGYGRIGQAVARRAEGFGMRVIHFARNDTGDQAFIDPGHTAGFNRPTTSRGCLERPLRGRTSSFRGEGAKGRASAPSCRYACVRRMTQVAPFRLFTCASGPGSEWVKSDVCWCGCCSSVCSNRANSLLYVR